MKTMANSDKETLNNKSSSYDGEENTDESIERAKFVKKLSKKLIKLGPSIRLMAEHNSQNEEKSIMVVKYSSHE